MCSHQYHQLVQAEHSVYPVKYRDTWYLCPLGNPDIAINLTVPELQRVLIDGYRGYLKRHGGRRPRRAEKYRDHGWDSLGHLSVIMEIEKALGISIGDDDAWKLDSMKAISEFFERHRGGGPEP